jgi:ceramide glucosyltransferase
MNWPPIVRSSAILYRMLKFWFWFLVGPSLLLAVLSLRGERAAREYTRSRLKAGFEGRLPPATVIVPVRGPEEGLAGNLAALANQDYPDYELIVAAYRYEDIPAGTVPAGARVVIARPGNGGTSEKIQNLLAAVRTARPESEILAFADSDGRPRPVWLRSLAVELEEPGAGAATGYRMYLPARPGIWNFLRSVWNAVVAGLFSRGKAPFVWGGATAIRREVFFRIDVPGAWNNQVSDDLCLTLALKRAGLDIRYAPGAMVASTDSTGGLELLQWIQRQLVLSRVFTPRLWYPAAVATSFYCGSMVACVWAALAGRPDAWIPLAAQLGMGMWKGASRGRLAQRQFPEYAEWFRRHSWIFTWLVPLGTWLWLCGFAASAYTNVIRWRGNTYKLQR